MTGAKIVPVVMDPHERLAAEAAPGRHEAVAVSWEPTGLTSGAEFGYVAGQLRFLIGPDTGGLALRTSDGSKRLRSDRAALKAFAETLAVRS